MFTHPRADKIEDALIGRIDAALRQKPPKIPAAYPKSPCACQFYGGTITTEIAENAEAVSAAWRRRMRATRSSGAAV